MSSPIVFTSRTPKFGLPFLFSGQAQKELYLNEALSLIDVLLHPVIEGTATIPPSQPNEGECWIIDSGSADLWIGQDGNIASYQAGSWLFVRPMEGMKVFDKSSSTSRMFSNGWNISPTISEPSGGAIVDIEARAVIVALIQYLADLGLVRRS